MNGEIVLVGNVTDSSHTHTHTRTHYRNGIQALDYAETMQFAFKEQGAGPLTAKIAK